MLNWQARATNIALIVSGCNLTRSRGGDRYVQSSSFGLRAA